VAYIDYTVTDKDGNVWMTTLQSKASSWSADKIQTTKFEPLKVTVGSANDFIPGVMKELPGMKVGQSKTVKLTPEQGFGNQYKPEELKKVPMKTFTSLGQTPQVNTVATFGNSQGLIKGFEGAGETQVVLIDFNPAVTWSESTVEFTVVK
jgi:FKBP-type peptidyl-prolyl cis-trans isomerase 2